MRFFKQLCIFLGLKLLEICALAGGFCILMCIVMLIEFLTIRFNIVLPGIDTIFFIFIIIIAIFFIGVIVYALYECIKDNWKWAGRILKGDK